MVVDASAGLLEGNLTDGNYTSNQFSFLAPGFSLIVDYFDRERLASSSRTASLRLFAVAVKYGCMVERCCHPPIA